MTAQRVLITAGAAGIGAAMARRFAAAGAQVAVCDVDEAALGALETGILARRADVTDEAAVEAVFAELAEAWGGLDVVAANAGTAGPTAAVEDVTLADWRACLAVNLDGAFVTARAAARLMKPQGGGLILLTASTAGLFGYPLRSPYATAKWGVIGLAKTLAMELGGHGIRVNALCPGAVEGPRMDRVVAREAAAKGITEAEVRDSYVQGVSLKTWVSAEDIAETAFFLASPAGAKISGQALAVDGHTESIVL